MAALTQIMLRDKLQAKMKIATQLDEGYVELVQRGENMKQDVEKFADNLIKTIKAKTQNMMTEVENETKKSLEAVTNKKNAIQQEIEEIQLALGNADQRLTRGRTAKVVAILEGVDQSELNIRELDGLFNQVFVGNHNMLDTVNDQEIGLLASRHQTSARKSVAEGQGLQEGTVGREAQFKLTTRNTEGRQCHHELDMITIQMRDERGQECLTKYHIENEDGIYYVSYFPRVQGKCNLSVMLNGKHVRRSPFNVVVKSFKVKPVLSFGKEGSGNGMFKSPEGVAVGSRDEIAVTSNHKVQIFDSKGNFVRSIGSKGRNQGQFDLPRGIVFDKDENILVSDYENHRIQIFSGEGGYVGMFGGKGHFDSQLWYPRGLSLDSSGNIIVADSGNKFIKIFSPDGNFLSKIGGPGSLTNPVHCVQSGEDLIVSDQDDSCIKVFTKEGEYKYKFGICGEGDGQLNFQQSLSVTKSGHVIVADTDNHRVQVFELNGKFVGKFGNRGNDLGDFDCPCSVAVLSNGQIVVSDHLNHRIQIFEAK